MYGSALLQKTYVADFLTKKCVKNNGVLPQYLVEDSHPDIVSKKIWEMAQSEFTRRVGNCRISCSDNPLTGKIVCGECGGNFGSKIWHSTSKYRRVVFRCNEKYKVKDTKCNSSHIDENTVTEAFMAVFNNIFDCKDEVIKNLELAITETVSEDKINKTMSTTQTELENLELEVRALIDKNATIRLNQEEYKLEYDTLMDRHQALTAEISVQEELLQKMYVRKQNTKIFMAELNECKTALTAFDEDLWNVLIESVTVFGDGKLVFKFRDGMEIEHKI